MLRHQDQPLGVLALGLHNCDWLSNLHLLVRWRDCLHLEHQTGVWAEQHVGYPSENGRRSVNVALHDYRRTLRYVNIGTLAPVPMPQRDPDRWLPGETATRSEP